MICSKKARTRRDQPANPSLTLVASVLKPPHDTSTLRCVAEPVLSLSRTAPSALRCGRSFLCS